MESYVTRLPVRNVSISEEAKINLSQPYEKFFSNAHNFVDCEWCN